MTTQNYDIWIDRGADFFLILKCRDDSGNLIDLTDAEITAQLREYPEALDYKQFTTEHNGEGGQILLTMAHEDTADIGYTSGVYDVFVELSGGSMQKYITGDVTISPSVTRPVYGQIAYLLEFATEADFPPVGQTRRVYFSQATTKMYTWNGTAYVGYTNYYTKSETDALLSEKSDVGHNHDDRYYTEAEVDTALSAKEDIANLKALAYKDKADFYDDIANLPSGYPPSPHNHDDRYYTEGEMDTALSAKADASDVYSKSDVDTALSGKSDTGHTHTMEDVTDLPTLGSLAEKDYVDYDTDIANLPTLGDLANHDTVDYDTEVTNKPTLGALAEKDTVDWDTDIDDIPSTFPPSSHTHTTSDITDFPSLGTMSAESASDYYDKTDTDALLQDKADIIHASASGSIVSISDGGAYPVTALTVGIEPVQSGSGDPSPDNIRPISGHTSATVTRTGKNIYQNNYLTDAYITGTSPHKIDTNSGSAVYYAPVTGGKTYVIQKTGSALRFRYGFTTTLPALNVGVSEYQQVLNVTSVTATAPSNAKYIVVYLSLGSDTLTIREATIKNISWQTEAGTVYGGTLDVLTGALTVTDGNIASYNGETLPSTWISDRDVYTEGGTPTTGAQVVYKLATPLTVQLTPAQLSTLLGENHIWADTGDTAVTYKADTKLFIERLTKPTEDDMVANTNIASGIYFMVGNSLFLSTASIASGEQIIVGTNCTALSLADALNNLNS